MINPVLSPDHPVLSLDHPILSPDHPILSPERIVLSGELCYTEKDPRQKGTAFLMGQDYNNQVKENAG